VVGRMAFPKLFLGTIPKKFGTVPKNWERFPKKKLKIPENEVPKIFLRF